MFDWENMQPVKNKEDLYQEYLERKAKVLEMVDEHRQKTFMKMLGRPEPINRSDEHS